MTDVVSTWCLILNKINSAKFYIGKHYFGVKTNDFSQEIMFFDSPIQYFNNFSDFHRILIQSTVNQVHLLFPESVLDSLQSTSLYNYLKYLFLCMCQSVLSSRS